MIQVKKQLNHWLDRFVSKYFQSIELASSKKVGNLLAEDTKQQRKLEDIRKYYGEILKIMKIIDNATEEDKLRTMECMYPQMRKIRMKVIKKDEALHKTGDALKDIMTDLVDLKTL